MIRLLQFPATLMGMFIVATVVALSLAGLLLVRRRLAQGQLRESNDLADSVYSMVGVLYAVLLAFMVVVVWEQFTTAEDHTRMEEGAVGDLYREAYAFPPATRVELQRHLLRYAADVVDHEWPRMAMGEHIELESAAFKDLWIGYLNFQPQTPEQVAFYTDSITRLNELGSQRKMRILDTESELPSILWVLLIGGSAISILFTYLFGTENHGIHMLVVGLLSALLSFVLFLIFSLEHPYSGALSVKPSGFRRILATHHVETTVQVPEAR